VADLAHQEQKIRVVRTCLVLAKGESAEDEGMGT
jgi:hypothetical protein